MSCIAMEHNCYFEVSPASMLGVSLACARTCLLDLRNPFGFESAITALGIIAYCRGTTARGSLDPEKEQQGLKG